MPASNTQDDRVEVETTQPVGIFTRIAVIGSGSLTLRIARTMLGLGRDTIVIEVPELTQFSLTPRAHRLGIETVRLSRPHVATYLLEQARQAKDAAVREADYAPYLVLSVENGYVFPAEVVRCPDLVIINYHNSLLPKHRGMNAEAWAIFDGDHKAGFTWHRVDTGIDTGRIIYQHEVRIGPKTTSLELLGRCSKQALKAFRDMFPLYERGVLVPYEQDTQTGTNSSHRIADRPAEATLDLAWEFDQASAFVRAYDYGKLQTLGRPTVCIDGKRHTWTSYRIDPPASDSPESPATDGKPRIDRINHTITFSNRVGDTLTLCGVTPAQKQQTTSGDYL